MNSDTPSSFTSSQLNSLFKELKNVDLDEEKRTLIRKRLMTNKASEIHQYAKHINNIGQIGTAIFNLIDREDDNIKQHQPVINDYFATLAIFNQSTYRSLFNDNDTPLNNLFVPLQLSAMDYGARAKKYIALPQLLQTAEPQPIQLLIQGNPGSGKSTLLSYIALNAWENPERIGLPKAYTYIPLYIKLQHLGSSNSPDLGKKFINAMAGSNFHMERTMPDNFFADWPQFLQARWLLLLDGYDEIEDKHRQSIDMLISQLLEKQIHIIITTRPTFQLSSKLKDRFDELLIEDFDDEQKTALAHNLFPGERDARLFLSQLSAYDHRRFGSTPLMVTVSAIVFKDNQKQLPATEIELYQHYMDNYLAEAFSRNDAIYFDQLKLKKTVLKVLKIIAFEMTHDSGQNAILDENRHYTALVNQVAHLVMERINYIDREEALELTTNYIRSLGKSSAIFQCTGNICSWLHPTFREYLAASFIIEPGNAQIPGLHTRESWQYLSKWKEDRWRKIVLFLLQKWSLHGEVSEVVMRMIEEARQKDNNTYCKAVIYVGTGLLCDIKVDDVTRLAIYEYLIGIVLNKTNDNYCNRLLTHVDDVLGERAADLIRQLSDDPLIQQPLARLVTALVTFAKNQQQNGDQALVVQSSVFFDLAKLGQLESLLQMARDESLIDDIRIAALYTLKREAWWFKGVVEKTIKSNAAEYKIASACNELLTSCNQEVVNILLSILKFIYQEEKKCNMILNLLQDYANSETLRAIIAHEEYSIEEVQLAVPEYLPVNDLETIVTDPEVNILIRMSATMAALKKANDNDAETYVTDRLTKTIFDLLDQYGQLDTNDVTWRPLPENLQKNIATYFQSTQDAFLKTVICQSAAPPVIKTAAIDALQKNTTRHDILVNSDIEPKYRRIIAVKLADSDLTAEGRDEEIYQSLLAYLQQETAADPDNLKMQISLSKVFNKANDIVQSDRALSHATDMLPQMAEAFRLRGLVKKEDYEYREAIKYFDIALRLDPDYDYPKYAKAECLMRLDRDEEAIAIFAEDEFFATIYPGFRWVYVNCLIRVKNYEKALSLCDEYLEDDSDVTLLAFRGIATSYTTPASQLNGVIEDLSSALAGDDDYNYARYMRYLAYRRQGRIADALQDYLRYAETAYGTPEGYDLKSMLVLLHARAGNLAEASSLMREVKQIHGDSSFILLIDAIILLLANRKQEAATALNRAREGYGSLEEMDGFMAVSLSSLALIDLLSGREEEAQQCLNLLVEKNERHQLLNYTLIFIDDLVVLFNNKAAARCKQRVEEQLFPASNTPVTQNITPRFDPDTLYAPRLPRASYPVPMYCQLSDISGLSQERIWAQTILDRYKRNRPATTERIVVLFTIKDNNIFEVLYGYCNFKMDEDAEHNLKFSERVDTLLEENLNALVQGYGVESFLFTEKALAEKFRKEVERVGLIARCVVVD